MLLAPLTAQHDISLDAEFGENYKTIIIFLDNCFVAMATAAKVAKFGSLRLRQYSSNMHQSWHAYSDNTPLPKCETLSSKMFIWKKIWALKEGQVEKEQKNRFLPHISTNKTKTKRNIETAIPNFVVPSFEYTLCKFRANPSDCLKEVPFLVPKSTDI